MLENQNFLTISAALKEISLIEDQVHCGLHAYIDFYEVYD